MKKNPRVGIIILVAISTLLLGAGVVWFLYNLAFTSNAEVTSGTVIELVQRGKYGYAPRVQFTDLDGTVHTFTSQSSQSPAIAQPGESITVFYHTNNPDQALVYSFVSLWFGPLMLYIAGTVNLVVSIILWCVLYKKTQPARKQTV